MPLAETTAEFALRRRLAAALTAVVAVTVEACKDYPDAVRANSHQVGGIASTILSEKDRHGSHL